MPETKTCPYCGKTSYSAAKVRVCAYCGAEIEPEGVREDKSNINTATMGLSDSDRGQENRNKVVAD